MDIFWILAGTWQKILKLEESGRILQELDFTVVDPKFRPVEMDCFLILKAERPDEKDEVRTLSNKWTVFFDSEW